MNQTMTAFDAARRAVFVLLEKKGLDVRLYAIADLCGFADYAAVATARSQRQLEALAGDVADTMHEAGIPARLEGGRGGNWFLVDAGEVIIHLFDTAGRQFYAMDRMYAEGAVDIADIRAEVDKKFTTVNYEEKE